MVGIIDALITRHGVKEKVKVTPGSEEDKKVDLSDAGKEGCFEQGKRNISANYTLIDITSSDFLRAMRTAERMAAGAGYQTDISTYRQRADWGLSGKNWEHSRVPPYGIEKAVADNFTQKMLTDLYFNKQDGAPALADTSFALTDGLVQGIERALPLARSGERVLLLGATHATLIDALDSAIYDTLNVEGENVTFKDFPGHYAMGEFLSGSSVDLTPAFRFMAKGREKIVSLDYLKKARDIAYEHSQRKY